ncbi:MAG TPA: hypothetical protein VME23_05185, partial [Terracidiphilus sp.]|nr:hypothetical protein [Terracidiphilus sp.]
CCLSLVQIHFFTKHFSRAEKCSRNGLVSVRHRRCRPAMNEKSGCPILAALFAVRVGDHESQPVGTWSCFLLAIRWSASENIGPVFGGKSL